MVAQLMVHSKSKDTWSTSSRLHGGMMIFTLADILGSIRNWHSASHAPAAVTALLSCGIGIAGHVSTVISCIDTSSITITGYVLTVFSSIVSSLLAPVIFSTLQLTANLLISV
ncbi:hypothetical protein K440DRAFT_635285 [Wilcoxina mikolae CBS 423.85]|nr:hypothetical protein K440DRAFT_635285 [Wilcoxina mikolae CBS 423.85]